MIPVKIGRYEIKEELGRGGMATVYRALDPRFKRDVAVKVLPTQFTDEPVFRARFEREAQTIAALEHPGIVPVYDFGEEERQPYLVMRYMPGGSLADRLKQGPMPIHDITHIITRLASALDAVHSKGIIHRDLKPANVLFDQYGEAYLSDFGIARLQEGAATLTGDSIIGTPAYMSPEQARGDPDIDGRSDIYALGAILFQMLTGKLPYEATTPMAVAMKHITDPVPRLSQARPDLPRTYEQVIDGSMAKDRSRRFPTGDQLASALETASRGQTAKAAAASPASPQTMKAPAAQPPSSPRMPPAPAVVQPVPRPPSSPGMPAQHAAQPPVPRPPSDPRMPSMSMAQAPGGAYPQPVAHPPSGEYYTSAERRPHRRIPVWIWIVGALVIVGGGCLGRAAG